MRNDERCEHQENAAAGGAGGHFNKGEERAEHKGAEKCDVAEAFVELQHTREASYFEQAGEGHLVGLSSVAGDRGRVGNPAYHTSKAALSTYLESLRNRLTRKGVHVLTVKPGYVDTDLLKAVARPFWVVSPEQAAADIWRAIRRGKQQIYTLSRWGLVMWVVRNIPSFIFRRLSF